MKFYVKQHKYYCGVDLHAHTMYVCIIDEKGAIVKQKKHGKNIHLKKIFTNQQ